MINPMIVYKFISAIKISNHHHPSMVKTLHHLQGISRGFLGDLGLEPHPD